MNRKQETRKAWLFLVVFDVLVG